MKRWTDEESVTLELVEYMGSEDDNCLLIAIGRQEFNVSRNHAIGIIASLQHFIDHNTLPELPDDWEQG